MDKYFSQWSNWSLQICPVSSTLGIHQSSGFWTYNWWKGKHTISISLFWWIFHFFIFYYFQAFPMELHFVTYNSKYKDIGDAIQYPDGLAVLGVLFEMSEYDNPNLNPILNAVPAIRKGLWEAWNTYPQNLRTLLPLDTKSIYRYQGSLTTPPCSEVVTWTVFHDKLPISERQLKALRTLSNYERYYLYSTYR